MEVARAQARRSSTEGGLLEAKSVRATASAGASYQHSFVDYYCWKIQYGRWAGNATTEVLLLVEADVAAVEHEEDCIREMPWNYLGWYNSNNSRCPVADFRVADGDEINDHWNLLEWEEMAHGCSSDSSSYCARPDAMGREEQVGRYGLLFDSEEGTAGTKDQMVGKEEEVAVRQPARSSCGNRRALLGGRDGGEHHQHGWAAGSCGDGGERVAVGRLLW
ncbi:hypothetical protein BHE74_00032970 [Ensete ventricosum]|nr:hypothetical protein BHE74_00032970 [Ensete ventricosum]